MKLERAIIPTHRYWHTAYYAVSGGLRNWGGHRDNKVLIVLSDGIEPTRQAQASRRF